MSNTTVTVERPVTDKNQEFAELMDKVANLEPKKKEQVIFYVQGFVAAAVINGSDKAAI